MPKERRGKRTYIREAPNPKVGPAQAREIIKRIKAGESKASVARALGVSRMHVWRVLDEHAPELIKRQ